ncbi:DUF6233 domain-containing protein [Streptomyces sp. NPDC057101]|uniref:DUF6233 domain-containing protein n=1 Tax=Streptomyces sp. NPDC057101 TaxID=3346020 RepID=UPI00363C1CBC
MPHAHPHPRQSPHPCPQAPGHGPHHPRPRGSSKKHHQHVAATPDGFGTGSGPKALRVHVGNFTLGGGKPISREEARRTLAKGVEPCPYCSPENRLGMTG